MKTWKTAAPLAGLLLFLTGCGTLLQQGIETLPAPVQDAAWGAVQAWADRRWSLQEPIDAFFAAVDARDAQALKALFSPNVQAADEDLEEQIQALLALYPGPTEDCEIQSPPGASQHTGWGENRHQTHCLVPVVCQGVSDYCSFSYTTRDEADEGNAGVTRVVFVTERVQANRAFRDALAVADGLTVVSDAPGDYETRRIGDTPYAFTPPPRPIPQAELLDFLETEDRWEAFVRHFGPPCAEGYASVYYLLEPEGDRSRYAHLYTQDCSGTERVSRVYLYDDRAYQPLETLWTSPQEEASP